MKRADLIPQKILTQEEAVRRVAQWRLLNKKIVFTNGVFDILHQGHIFSLSQAAREGDMLIIGLNADASVKRLKGDSRPVNNQESRALVLASLVMVDAVVLFEEDSPLELIKSLMPDVLVKGGDYTVEQIAGAKEVIANGGHVVINPILEGFSTTNIIQQISNNK
ncbi:MAG TPA: D-glycero-beta-D-manno-heptose 1-phosphate adenylyltransferase [Chitinophagaceae bacterium]|nr:D-glycero-beta-D-manno-heptose 1-phosphate adenylyltransferase [Chitinophagaceae bacterium]